LEYDFVDADDLAQCFASWVEFELRQEQWDNALSVSRTSIAPATASSEKTKSNRASRALFKSFESHSYKKRTTPPLSSFVSSREGRQSSSPSTRYPFQHQLPKEEEEEEE